MREVRFVDTSIVCDLVRVPGKCQRHDEVRGQLVDLVRRGVVLILPMAAVIETGNHIVQAADGRARRESAERFVDVLRRTADGDAPWALHAVGWDERFLRLLCDGTEATGGFVDLAAAGVLGTGDLSILAERELYLGRTTHLDVRIWTHDNNLAAYA